jgi:hypothetical protein
VWYDDVFPTFPTEHNAVTVTINDLVTQILFSLLTDGVGVTGTFDVAS